MSRVHWLTSSGSGSYLYYGNSNTDKDIVYKIGCTKYFVHHKPGILPKML